MVLVGILAGGAVAEDGTPTLRAGALVGRLEIDGRLDEPAWAAAEAIPDLVMTEPRAGGKPTGRTTVRVLADARAVVFGLDCQDPEPAGIVSFTKERDGDFEEEDHVLVVLDTFQDGRSGYVFAVNPAGARFDGLVSGNGEDVDESWDGVWEAATRRDGDGWSAEIRIPAQSISFGRGLTAWRLNVQRRIQRLQETARWASPRPDIGPFQTSRAGLLTDLPAFELGWGLTVRPAGVAGFTRPPAPEATDSEIDASVDVTKRLGPDLTAAVTVNTDFAETEVDARQTNLTRFPLFFPEKRAFFLEGSDIFDFGLGLAGSLRPFFSRRIGLVEGQSVPLLGGLKLTGRSGGGSLGGLLMRTREEASRVPAATLAAFRLERNLLGESSVGLIATAGDPLGRAGSFLVGLDATYQTSRFQGGKNLWVGVWGLLTRRDGLVGDKAAWGLKVDYPNDLWDVALTYRRVGDGFDPSLGFVPRRAVSAYRLSATFAPRPHGTFLRQMFHQLVGELFTDPSGRWESYRVFTAPVNWQLESGDRVELNFVPAGERLVEPFEIEDGVVVPPGSYGWRRWRIEAETAAKRRLAGQVSFWFGGFYGGRLRELQVEAAFNPSPLVTFELSAEHNVGRLPQGDFTQTLLGLRARLNLSPDWQVTSFVQYDDGSRTLGSNTRLRWTFRPQGDLFVVYNHNLRRSDGRFRREENEILLKVQYAFRR